MSKHLFIGFEFSPKADWQKFMGEPKKPKNWKEETYQEKLPELREKQKEGAAQHLMAGSVNRACALLHDKRGLSKLAMGVTGPKLLEILDGIVGTDATVFGVETLESLRLCGWGGNGPVPRWIWNSGIETGVTLVNLYSCSGAKQAGLSETEMLDYWVAAEEAVEVLGSVPDDASTETAARVYLMAKAMGLTE